MGWYAESNWTWSDSMISNYIELNKVLRKITNLVMDLQDTEINDPDGYSVAKVNDYLDSEVNELERLWPKNVSKRTLTSLKIVVGKTVKDYLSIKRQISLIGDSLDKYFISQPTTEVKFTIIDYLHPRIISSSYAQFKNGLFRDAVLNSIIAVFDYIKERTGIGTDGAELVGEVFSLSNPKLVISNLSTENGKNEQKGMLQILQGAYVGIRNPKAHSLLTDLDERKAAEYLIFASLLARRVEEAHIVEKTQQPIQEISSLKVNRFL
jgi:uncharacterized protein (TIGR02391 family)